MAVPPLPAPQANPYSTEGPAAAPPVRAVPDFEAFLRAEYPPVLGLAYALSGSRLAAPGIARDTFRAARRRWDWVASYGQPRAWVRRVACDLAGSRWGVRRREAAALLRRRGREGRLPPLTATDAEFFRAVRSLPRRRAQAVALHYLEGWPAAAIAAVLGRSENAVQVHLRKGRARLARRFHEREEVVS